MGLVARIPSASLLAEALPISQHAICIIDWTALPVHSLQLTVNERAAYRNGEVIGRAFKETSISCPNCSYPEHAQEFHMWLSIHIHNKLDLHRAQRAYNWHYDVAGEWCHRENYWHGLRGSSNCCRSVEQAVYKAKVDAIDSREILKDNWPCEDCIRKYNPTARLNHVIRNRPELKGFLDVRFD